MSALSTEPSPYPVFSIFFYFKVKIYKGKRNGDIMAYTKCKRSHKILRAHPWESHSLQREWEMLTVMFMKKASRWDDREEE